MLALYHSKNGFFQRITRFFFSSQPQLPGQIFKLSKNQLEWRIDDIAASVDLTREEAYRGLKKGTFKGKKAEDIRFLKKAVSKRKRERLLWMVCLSVLLLAVVAVMFFGCS